MIEIKHKTTGQVLHTVIGDTLSGADAKVTAEQIQIILQCTGMEVMP